MNIFCHKTTIFSQLKRGDTSGLKETMEIEQKSKELSSVLFMTCI